MRGRGRLCLLSRHPSPGPTRPLSRKSGGVSTQALGSGFARPPGPLHRGFPYLCFCGAQEVTRLSHLDSQGKQNHQRPGPGELSLPSPVIAERPGRAPRADGRGSSRHTPHGFSHPALRKGPPRELPSEERERTESGRTRRKEVGRRKRAFSLVTRVRELRKGAPQWQRRLPLPWRRT